MPSAFTFSSDPYGFAECPGPNRYMIKQIPRG